MMHITPRAAQLRPAIDAVIFDMDGVLLDISRSIRVVNCLAVPFYLREILRWPVGDDLLTSSDIELFKNAGGFNDDWDLTYALVLHYLHKGRENPDASPETLNVIQPNLNRFAARIKERGGWLRAAEEIVFEKLTREDRLAIETHYRKPLIRQCFEELMAGEHCQRLYGYPAKYYQGRGYINDDRVILDISKIPEQRKIGVQTGRTYEEARLGMEFTGLDDLIPDEHVVTKRDGFHKPEPGGLALLQERLGFTTAIYIGDTIDDFRTVRAFNERGFGNAQFLSAQVLTGPAGRANERLFRSAGADLVAPDVNAVLDWIVGRP